MAGVTVAYYLVHSMLPQAALTQAGFDDMDLLCADNFARAARSCGVKHIVYLSGLVPESKTLSRHLASRLEVEKTLGAHGVPLTTLRAGLVIGPGGSSFQLMARLVDRLPVMPMPPWIDRKIQVVAVRDVVTLLRYVADKPDAAGSYDVANPQTMTYEQLLQETADVLGKKPRMIKLGFDVPSLSLLAVSVISRMPRELVRPLMESLQHDMVARDNLRLQTQAGLDMTPVRAAIEDALQHKQAPRVAKSATNTSAVTKTVLSVQRIPMPLGVDAQWAAYEYARWLPKFFRPLLKVVVRDARVYRFCVPLTALCLLELTFSEQRSSASRQLFYISGGALAKTSQANPGRFEFRTVLDGKWALSAVQDFAPRLPWLLYKATQALAHLWVMKFFGRHLLALRSRGAMKPAPLPGK